MIKSMSDYEIVDFLLLDYIEPGDMINYAGQDYFVKHIDFQEESWFLVVIDRMEEELELTLTDGTVVGLCLVD